MNKRIIHNTEKQIGKLDIRKATLFAWLNNYKNNSIEGLKNKKRLGNNRNLSFEQEKEFFKQFKKRLKNGKQLQAKK